MKFVLDPFSKVSLKSVSNDTRRYHMPPVISTGSIVEFCGEEQDVVVIGVGLGNLVFEHVAVDLNDARELVCTNWTD